MKYILRPAITLFLIAAIIIALVSYVNNITQNRRDEQKESTLKTAMRKVLPGAEEYVELSSAEKSGSINAVYEGIKGGELIGYVVSLSAKGYSGNIDFIVGISLPDEIISGISILRLSETPGLGALAKSENFENKYKNRTLVPLNVVRNNPGENDIQAITSATITTRAVTNAVNEAIRWYNNEDPPETDATTSPTVDSYGDDN